MNRTTELTAAAAVFALLAIARGDSPLFRSVYTLAAILAICVAGGRR